MKSTTKESTVEAYFRRQVRRAGGLTYKFTPLVKGNPDRIVLAGGRVLLVELKQDHTNLSPAQRVWHARAAQCGVRVYVLHGTGEVDAFVQEELAR